MANSENTSNQAASLEDIVGGLREEFINETRDELEDLLLLLEQTRSQQHPSGDLINEARKFAHVLVGQGTNVGLRLISTVAHRLGIYLDGCEPLTERGIKDIERYIDTLSDIIQGKISRDTDPSTLVRALPPKTSFEVSEVEIRNTEVLLVMLDGTATKFVEREMQQCGYRVSNVASPFDALPLVIQTKPDLVIISAVLPDLSGIDFAIALSSMPETRNMPIALITSFPRDHESLQFLPDSVPVIQKGPSFGDDLVEALNNAFLL